MLLLQLAVGLDDRLEKLDEAGSLVDRPEPREAMAQQLDLTLREQPYGDNALLRQRGAPA